MTRRGVVAVVALAAMGCSGPPEPNAAPDPAEPDATSPEQVTPDASPVPGGPAPDTVAVLTEDDDGSEVALEVGERFALRFGHDWVWRAPQVDGAAVRVAPVQYESDPGFTEWSIEAAEPGTARIRVQGEPNCPDPGDCPPRTVELDVTVER